MEYENVTRRVRGTGNLFLNAWRPAKYARYFDRRDNIYCCRARATAEVSFKFIENLAIHRCTKQFRRSVWPVCHPLPPLVLLNKHRGRSLSAGNARRILKRESLRETMSCNFIIEDLTPHFSLFFSLTILKNSNFPPYRVILIWRDFCSVILWKVWTFFFISQYLLTRISLNFLIHGFLYSLSYSLVVDFYVSGNTR